MRIVDPPHARTAQCSSVVMTFRHREGRDSELAGIDKYRDDMSGDRLLYPTIYSERREERLRWMDWVVCIVEAEPSSAGSSSYGDVDRARLCVCGSLMVRGRMEVHV